MGNTHLKKIHASLVVMHFAALGANADEGGIFTTGTPHCVEDTDALLSDRVVEIIFEILGEKPKDHEGRELIKGGKRLTISDCETFYTAVVLETLSDGGSFIAVDVLHTVFFFKNSFLPPFLRALRCRCPPIIRQAAGQALVAAQQCLKCPAQPGISPMQHRPIPIVVPLKGAVSTLRPAEGA